MTRRGDHYGKGQADVAQADHRDTRLTTAQAFEQLPLVTVLRHSRPLGKNRRRCQDRI